MPLFGIHIFVVAACVLVGCSPTTRTVRHQTGVVNRISGGILTTNMTETAFFVIETTCGDYAFTSDDIRKPQEILKNVRGMVDAIESGSKESVTINIYNSAYKDWTVYSHDRRVFLPSGQCWIRNFFTPAQDIAFSFRKDVNVPFVFHERTERSVKTTASGP